ncbi:hypothetical protein ZWY2020_012079 [Hordeum vulgare]|nr:hypothetical protein ZWY2020_012079 [Hordeum vulgare]
MARLFDANGEYVPFFGHLPPPFAHNRQVEARRRAADPPMSVFRRAAVGGGRGGNALDSVLRVLDAPLLPGPYWSPSTWASAWSPRSLGVSVSSSRSLVRITMIVLDVPCMEGAKVDPPCMAMVNSVVVVGLLMTHNGSRDRAPVLLGVCKYGATITLQCSWHMQVKLALN